MSFATRVVSHTALLIMRSSAPAKKKMPKLHSFREEKEVWPQNRHSVKVLLVEMKSNAHKMRPLNTDATRVDGFDKYCHWISGLSQVEQV